MSHKHHNCSCPHENVKYCKTCKVVHCEDCNQEWSAKPVYNWSINTPYIYGNATVRTPSWEDKLATGNGNTIKADPSWQVTPTVTHAKVCEHKDGD